MFPALNHLDFTWGWALLVFREVFCLISSYSLLAKGWPLVLWLLVSCPRRRKVTIGTPLCILNACSPVASLHDHCWAHVFSVSWKLRDGRRINRQAFDHCLRCWIQSCPFPVHSLLLQKYKMSWARIKYGSCHYYQAVMLIVSFATGWVTWQKWELKAIL